MKNWVIVRICASIIGILIGILVINTMPFFIFRLYSLLLAGLCGLVFISVAKHAILKRHFRVYKVSIALTFLSFSAIIPATFNYLSYRVELIVLKYNAGSIVDDIDSFIKTNHKLPNKDSGLRGVTFCAEGEFNTYSDDISIFIDEKHQTYSICYWKSIWVQMRYDSVTGEWQKNDFD